MMLTIPSLLVSLGYGLSVSAAVYNWDITWVNRNPDGLHERPVIGINNQWPVPAITASVGEQITIYMTNQLGNETTSVHFHGLFQNGTNSMDGPTGVTQCPIGPGETFTYVFTVSNTPLAAIETMRLNPWTDYSAWHLLVSLSQPRPIPGRIQRANFDP